VAANRQVKRPARRKALDGSHNLLKTLVKSNNIVLIGYVRSLLDGADLPHALLDTNMSVLEGSLGVLPQRVVVAEEDFARARMVLHEAGLADECA
jgi:hypothetical protein